MRDLIFIKDRQGMRYSFYLRFRPGVTSISFKISKLLVIEVRKNNLHNYDLRMFFYEDEYIYSFDSFRSKHEVISAIQSLLEDAWLK